MMEIVELLLSTYGGASLVAGLLTVKGIASVIANNFNTESWGKAGDVIDWLASNNKKAKFTGNTGTDLVINEILERKKAKGKLSKFLRFLS